MKLYFAPPSTYSQKALMAFYEKQVAFEPEIVNLMDPEAKTAYKEIYPLAKIPLLILDDGHMIPESSIIIEYIDMNFDSGISLIPQDPESARKVRFADRMNDLYLNNPIVTLFFQNWKPEEERDQDAIASAKSTVDIIYGYMNQQLLDNDFCNGDSFSMADCGAAPPLNYAQQVHPFDEYEGIVAYFKRLQGRESWQKIQEMAVPFLENLMASRDSG